MMTSNHNSNGIDKLKGRTWRNSSDWYRAEDDDGNILHTAIKQRNFDLFDYLLSLPDLPLEDVNHDGETPLMMAVTRHALDFALQLIKRGANIHTVLPDGTTLLMRYFEETYYCDENFVVYLLHLGAPVCKHGERNIVFEWVTYLKNSFLRDTIFLYTFDKHSRYPEISLWTLLHLALEKIDYFFEVIDAADHIVYVHECRGWDYRGSCYKTLFDIEIKYLEVLLKKGDEAIINHLEDISCGMCWICFRRLLQRPDCLDVLNLIFQSDDVRNWLFDYFDKFLNNSFKYIPFFHEEEFFLLLLSYGFRITENLLEKIYCRHENCELLQMMLNHMDIEKDESCDVVVLHNSAMATLMLNLNIDLSFILHNWYFFCDLEELIKFFVIPNITSACDDLKFIEKGRSLQKVPSLQELARNTFRKCLIERFGAKTSKRLYTMISRLPIPELCKKILTLQQPLYF